jgi:hypothetical protein
VFGEPPARRIDENLRDLGAVGSGRLRPVVVTRREYRTDGRAVTELKLIARGEGATAVQSG